MENVTSEMKVIMTAIARSEQLGVLRAGLLTSVQEDVKAIDTARKEARLTVTSTLKGMADHSLATQYSNILCPAVVGQNDADKKKLQRRRSFLVGCLSTAYPNYDFEVTKGRGTNKIEASYVGEPEVREARALLASLAVVASYGFTLPEIGQSDLASAIKAGSVSSDSIPTINTNDLMAELNIFAKMVIPTADVVAASNHQREMTTAFEAQKNTVADLQNQLATLQSQLSGKKGKAASK